MRKPEKKIWERLVPISQANRSFDIEFWQSQSPTVRFAAVSSLIETAYMLKRKKIDMRTFRLQKNIEKLQPIDAADTESLRLRLKLGAGKPRLNRIRIKKK